MSQNRDKMTNQLYYGDNLQVLRDSVANESVDLVYLDPPFNSQANYNVLFKAPTGEQVRGPDRSLRGYMALERSRGSAFDKVMKSGNGDVAELLRALRSFLKENDMMAYLTMMAIRLLELHRVLKSTGSLYLHCDPTASHYLKILMDGDFWRDQFPQRNHLEAQSRTRRDEQYRHPLWRVARHAAVLREGQQWEFFPADGPTKKHTSKANSPRRRRRKVISSRQTHQPDHTDPISSMSTRATNPRRRARQYRSNE